MGFLKFLLPERVKCPKEVLERKLIVATKLPKKRRKKKKKKRQPSFQNFKGVRGQPSCQNWEEKKKKKNLTI